MRQGVVFVRNDIMVQWSISVDAELLCACNANRRWRVPLKYSFLFVQQN